MKKFKYLITTERNAYMCSPHKTTEFYTLSYPLNTQRQIERFNEHLNPENYFTHLVILFIYELKSSRNKKGDSSEKIQKTSKETRLRTPM